MEQKAVKAVFDVHNNFGRFVYVVPLHQHRAKRTNERKKRVSENKRKLKNELKPFFLFFFRIRFQPIFLRESRNSRSFSVSVIIEPWWSEDRKATARKR